jgi:hypothetical protein
MSWLGDLRQSRSSRPQTTGVIEEGKFFDTEVGEWLRASFETDDEDQRLQAVDRLREGGERVMEAIARTYADSPDDDAMRWAMVRCASEVGGPQGVRFLTEVLRAEIRPERSPDVHLYSTVAEEATQRMQAIRGLVANASEQPEALPAVLEALGHPLQVVRYAAYRALMELPVDLVARDDVESRVLSTDRDFARIRLVDIQAQVWATDEELGAGRHTTTPPEPGATDSGSRRTGKRAPQVPHEEGRDLG